MGKGPLVKAVTKLYPGLKLDQARPILCHSRRPRGGEVHGKDYYFLPPALIKSLRSSNDFVVAPVRSDWQAIDLLQVEDILRDNGLVFAEVFHTFGQPLGERAAARSGEGGFEAYSVFLLPEEPCTPDDDIVQTMQVKLAGRGTDEGAKLEERARSAPVEMRSAGDYTHCLLNHAGEDDVAEWGEFDKAGGRPGSRAINGLGDLGQNARWLVETFVQILQGALGPGDYHP
ncbi:MAG: hypothetical protein JO250_15645 [Armatimonadetes bacterium]|nr:hypothetical protein [Armatimonadota bacterium]